MQNSNILVLQHRLRNPIENYHRADLNNVSYYDIKKIYNNIICCNFLMNENVFVLIDQLRCIKFLFCA